METINEVIEAATEVHDTLGAGHTEATYHRALERELSGRGIPFSSENTIPITYKGTTVGSRRPDIFVTTDDGIIIIELKADTERGEEQLIDYERILADDSNFDIAGGLLIQFNDDLHAIES
jgi:GxxExxY protein